jgi:hypothetical protein
MISDAQRSKMSPEGLRTLTTVGPTFVICSTELAVSTVTMAWALPCPDEKLYGGVAGAPLMFIPHVDKVPVEKKVNVIL